MKNHLYKHNEEFGKNWDPSIDRLSKKIIMELYKMGNKEQTEMAKYSPKVDIAFRKLFGSRENTHILLALLNALNPVDEPLEEVTIDNPYILENYKENYKPILDIKAFDSKKRWYSIEMQMSYQKAFGARALYYLSRLNGGQMFKGMNYHDLRPVIGINFLDFIYFYGDDDYYRKYSLMDEERHTSDERFNFIRMHFFEFPKFRKQLEELDSSKDKWIFFLNNAGYYYKDTVSKVSLVP